MLFAEYSLGKANGRTNGHYSSQVRLQDFNSGFGTFSETLKSPYVLAGGAAVALGLVYYFFVRR